METHLLTDGPFTGLKRKEGICAPSERLYTLMDMQVRVKNERQAADTEQKIKFLTALRTQTTQAMGKKYS